ncbi:MAG: hypothetical protein BMS9Abin34_523 [Patescibacteria group bacterium]|nr:MAG: hypothetical protein BMS9Abin34_523 [Patescibacteria group bacterium]
MDKRVVMVFLVLALFTAALASLLLLTPPASGPMEYKSIQELAAQDCREVGVPIEDGVILDIKALDRYRADLLARGGFEAQPWEYSHLGDSYVQGTQFCWMVSFSRSGDENWTVLYETGDGELQVLTAKVH